MKKIHIELIMPEGKKIDEMVDSINVPGVDGDFEILPDHTPFITKIRPGTLCLNTNNKTTKYAIHDGFITVDKDKVIIISEIAESEKEIDLNRAKLSKERAEKRIFNSKDEDIDYRRAEVSLHKAVARINTIG
ncbi:MAG: F0F1 ATP synthase subunit epsilon [Candidatus Cloacimonadales bacterium]|jgi:F-type H+-transporting ATPase subunit epsilon|nr:F0F1 ATP synthase subunit epsilon [Candidatus Cloacimonadota bacterium]MDD2650767.1 F0F1 ATP synthase subunit epsilon [Candidatus Cloacimonadota bacterium]MDD3501205.1 F0F1 ATP synthase subunit epsilon [Candidatus Cloacimonadota bacterium]MDX9977418.1 F0F1 ATP synthase subunit epsilon [Candidatus Cloacimonadales bacterium]